jgi:Tfp pilus assembly PilM family ATPase
VGGGAKLKNIDAYFTQVLGIPTAVGNPLVRLSLQAPRLTPEDVERQGPAFATALGLAVRDLV